MNDKGLQGWLKKHESGEQPSGLSADEQAELARYDRLWEAAVPPASTFEVDTEAAWSKLDDRLFGDDKVIALDSQKSRQGGGASSFNILRIAAAIIVLAVAAFSIVGYLNEEAATVLAFSAGDDIEEVSLPDGTKISLNKNTELTYVADAATRQLELNGEAFFEVARDEERPFTIITGDLTTTVLGTSFNIRAYENEKVEVSVKSGKVAVAAAEEEVVLTKAEKVIYVPEAKSLEEKSTTTVEADVWKAEEMFFNEEKLATILPVLEQYFGVKFQVVNEAVLTSCEFRGNVRRNDLGSFLETVTFNSNLTFSIQDDIILVKGEPCGK